MEVTYDNRRIMEQVKQTAVEWLFEQVVNLDWRNFQGDKKLEIFNQAKIKEKEQIVNAVDGFPLNNRNLEGEQYYEQTYGG